MTLTTLKFSEMTNAGDLKNNQVTVGLDNNDNARFNNPWTFLASGSTASRPAPSPDINYRLRFNTDVQLYEYYDAVAASWIQLVENTPKWVSVTAPIVTMDADTSYIANNPAGNTQFVLPISAPVGTILNVVGGSSLGWVITQNAGQSIRLGNITSTIGVIGQIEATSPTDSLSLVCIVANLTWATYSVVGNLNYI